VKVVMSKIPSYTGPAYPLYSPIEVVTATCIASYNHRAIGFLSGKHDSWWLWCYWRICRRRNLADFSWLGSYRDC
jgi:hypothetical protein